MESLYAYWSKSKQKDLEAQLVGFWAEDIWHRNECPLAKDVDWRGKNGVIQGKKQIHFNCLSKSINTEIKYVLWQRLEQQKWSPITVWRFIHIHVRWIIEWMNAYLNILAQALPNGLCSLPVIQGACPHGANKCLNCTHFKTDIRYLDKHKEHLERTSKIVEWAQQNPNSRRSKEILKENLPVQENLERIISTLEASHDA